MIKKTLFIVLSMGLFFSNVAAQTNVSRDDLQKQEQNLRKEIDELNQLLEQTKKNKKKAVV